MTGNDIDDDIREVFLEEFDEEIVNLGQLLPAWSSNPDNMERLRPIRRVFHTLKGSGRLVGAQLLGEFSWKIENMLNRVLDGSRPPSDAVIALLEQSTKVLPQLNAALRGQGQVSADLQGLQELSDRVAAGEEVFYSAKPAVAAGTGTQTEADEQTTETFAVETEGTPAVVDAVLREILETEVGAHLETVDKWLAQAQSAARPADESLLRAFHTMNGAFAMADVPEITEVTGAAEQYVKRLWSAKEVPSAEGVAALAASAHAIRRSVAALQAASPRIPVFATLSAQLAALRDSLPEARLAAVTVGDSGQGTYAEAMPSIEPPVAPSDVELSVHDLSAYIGHEEPAAVEFEAHAPSSGAEAEDDTGADQSIGEPVSDDQQIVFEEAQPEPVVTFFDMELIYARAPARTGTDEPVAESVDAAIGADAGADETAQAASNDGLEVEPIEAIAEDALVTEEPAEAVDLESAPMGSDQVEDDEFAIEPVADEARTVDALAIEDPAIEEMAAEETAAQEPVIEAQHAESPHVEEPAGDAFSLGAAAVEEPAAEEPAVEETGVRDGGRRRPGRRNRIGRSRFPGARIRNH